MKPEKTFEQVVLDFEVSFEDFLPKRLEILAEGFAKGWTASQVNERLLENDCETLTEYVINRVDRKPSEYI